MPCAILIGMDQPQHIRLGVIGTAGRRDDAARLSADSFKRMTAVLVEFVREREIATLVSGGAAWADHLAVALFNKGHVNSLRLHLPSEFCLSIDAFVEPYPRSSGSVSNAYHRKFSRTMEASSLRSLGRAMTAPNCLSQVYSSFEERNRAVASDATELFAFTFGNGARLKAGGTLQTVKEALDQGKRVHHVDLGSFQLFPPEAVDAANR